MENRVTCKALVARACLQWPECKNNYGILYHRVAGLLDINSLDDYFSALARGAMYSPETISRAYRELRTEMPEVFNPSENVKENRVNHFMLTRAYYASKKTKEVDRINERPNI